MEDLLIALRERSALGTKPTVVWTKAHAGNIGNEMADTLAYDRCEVRDEPPEWEREEKDVRIRKPPSSKGKGELVS